MTKKHYCMIAEAFRNIRLRDVSRPYNVGFNDGIEAAANELAGTLSMDNPLFDRAIFLIACGVVSK